MANLRFFVWMLIGGCIGGILSLFGLNVIDHPVWFVIIDVCFTAASWPAFNLLWPEK